MATTSSRTGQGKRQVSDTNLILEITTCPGKETVGSVNSGDSIPFSHMLGFAVGVLRFSTLIEGRTVTKRWMGDSDGFGVSLRWVSLGVAGWRSVEVVDDYDCCHRRRYQNQHVPHAQNHDPIHGKRTQATIRNRSM